MKSRWGGVPKAKRRSPISAAPSKERKRGGMKKIKRKLLGKFLDSCKPDEKVKQPRKGDIRPSVKTAVGAGRWRRGRDERTWGHSLE